MALRPNKGEGRQPETNHAKDPSNHLVWIDSPINRHFGCAVANVVAIAVNKLYNHAIMARIELEVEGVFATRNRGFIEQLVLVCVVVSIPCFFGFCTQILSTVLLLKGVSSQIHIEGCRRVLHLCVDG